jgi:hypothetical protein
MSSNLLDELVLYLRLAQAYEKHLQMPDRDRALVLAGGCAGLLKLTAVDGFCRQLILQNNQGHMVRRWKSFAEALKDDDFHVFLKQLARRLSVERAEAALRELRFECDVRRSDYASDFDYVAAVMGVDPDWLSRNFS